MSAPPKTLAKAKRAVLKSLRDRGIANVEIVYDGEGDSGQIGDITARDAKNQPVDINRPVRLALREGEKPTRYASLREALDDFAWTVLDHYHGGFVNDDGGCGSITINALTGAVTLDHRDRVIVIETIDTMTEV